MKSKLTVRKRHMGFRGIRFEIHEGDAGFTVDIGVSGRYLDLDSNLRAAESLDAARKVCTDVGLRSRPIRTPRAGMKPKDA